MLVCGAVCAGVWSGVCWCVEGCVLVCGVVCAGVWSGVLVCGVVCAGVWSVSVEWCGTVYHPASLTSGRLAELHGC